MRKMRSFLFFGVLCIFWRVCSCYKILLYNPKFGKSHVTFTGKIADTLAAAGHEVVVYQPILDDRITITGSKNESIRYFTMPKSPEFDTTSWAKQDRYWEEESLTKMKNTRAMIQKLKSGFCELVMNDNENLNKLKAENFDLGISELFESCGFGVFKKIGLKKYITTFGSSVFPSSVSLLGIKRHTSYLPALLMSTSTDEMSFFQRVLNYIFYFVEDWWIRGLLLDGTPEVVQKQFPDFKIDDAIADSAFYFVNSDEHVDYPQPITHKIIYMAGLNQIQAQPLEKKYTDIFDSAEKGVILFSFGSVVQSSSMKPEMKKAFLEAFSEFPEINFLWKYEIDEDQISNGYKNVFTGKWLPQNDILDHPKLLAFISHGGMNSVMEGSSKGIPMICIPIFADQKRNSLLLVRRGTAIKIDKNEISKETIVSAIKEIISNEKYRKNAKLISKMVSSKPMSGPERVVKYAEFAAEFGDTETLQTHGRHQLFWVLYSLDVIGFLVTVIGGGIGIVVFVIFKLLKFLNQKLYNTENVKKNN